jgi:hypothetical protein
MYVLHPESRPLAHHACLPRLALLFFGGVGHNSGKTIIADVDMLAALLFSFFIFIMQAKLLLEVDTVLLCTVGYPDAKPIFLLINFFFVS